MCITSLTRWRRTSPGGVELYKIRNIRPGFKGGLWMGMDAACLTAKRHSMSPQLTPSDWLDLFTHFAALSLLGVGGAITTAPDMHRYLVGEKQWLTDPQFTSSIALAQAAPGPNVLFVALMGWNVGLNAGGGLGAGAPATSLAMLGMLII